MSQLLTAADAAAALGLKYSTIRTAIADGVLTPGRVGRLLVFPAVELDAIRAKLAEAGLLKSPTVIAVSAFANVLDEANKAARESRAAALVAVLGPADSTDATAPTA